MNNDLTGVSSSIPDAHERRKEGRFFRRGEENFSSLLSEADVLRIYRSTGTVAEVAQEFGVHRNTVSMIRNGRRWAWLTQSQDRAEGAA